MKTYFVDNKSNELVLFFLGWGMDELPMLPFKSSRDILYLYDYSNLDYEFDFSKYLKIYLIGYSAGVSIATYLKLPKIEYAVAINGTFDLCNEEYGLSKDIIDVFRGITLDNYMDFRRKYLVATDSELDFFNAHAPLRTIESSMEELDALSSYEFKNKDFKYDKVYISDVDRVFPIVKQKEFWGENVKVLRGAHFPFRNFKNLDEIFAEKFK